MPVMFAPEIIMKSLFYGFVVFAVFAHSAFADDLPGTRHGRSATARKAILKDAQSDVNGAEATKGADTSRARLNSEVQVDEASEQETAKDRAAAVPSTSHGRHGRSVMARESILRE